jgi:hypothetical protein
LFICAQTAAIRVESMQAFRKKSMHAHQIHLANLMDGTANQPNTPLLTSFFFVVTM